MGHYMVNYIGLDESQNCEYFDSVTLAYARYEDLIRSGYSYVELRSKTITESIAVFDARKPITLSDGRKIIYDIRS